MKNDCHKTWAPIPELHVRPYPEDDFTAMEQMKGLKIYRIKMERINQGGQRIAPGTVIPPDAADDTPVVAGCCACK